MTRRSAADRYARHYDTLPTAPPPTLPPEPAPPPIWVGPGDQVAIGDAVVAIVGVRRSGVVRLGIAAPSGVAIHRGEDRAFAGIGSIEAATGAAP